MARQSLYELKKDGITHAIRVLTTAQGRSPSLREVAAAADISVATLHSYLQKMRREGLVKWSERHHRSLAVLQAGSSPNGHASVVSSGSGSPP